MQDSVLSNINENIWQEQQTKYYVTFRDISLTGKVYANNQIDCNNKNNKNSKLYLFIV